MLSPLSDYPSATEGSFLFDPAKLPTYTVQNGALVISQTGYSDTGVTISLPCNSLPTHSGSTTEFPLLKLLEGSACICRTGSIAISEGPCTIVAYQPFLEGSTWQLHFPSGLSGISLGLCRGKHALSPSKYILHDFVASSARTVTLRLSDNMLSTWINGYTPRSNHQVQLPSLSDSEAFFVCVKISEKNNLVALRPFVIFPKLPNSNNPFGDTASISPPTTPAVQCQDLSSDAIENVYKLGSNRLLIRWANGCAKIILRNKKNRNFYWPKIKVSNDAVANLFSPYDYIALEQAAKSSNLTLLVQSQWYTLESIREWLHYYASSLNYKDHQYAYTIVIYKLISIRPYLSKPLPNLIKAAECDRESYKTAENLFPPELQNLSFEKAVSIREKPCVPIKGAVCSISQNYLCSLDNSKCYIYFTAYSLIQIAEIDLQAEQIVCARAVKYDNLLPNPFAQRNISQTAEIFDECLRLPSEVIPEKDVPVNQVHLKDLCSSFKVDAAVAEAALKKFTEYEDALTWALTVDTKSFEAEKHKTDLPPLTPNDVQIIYVSLPVSRLLLRVGKIVYLVGLYIGTVSSVIRKHGDHFLDLTSFMPVQSIDDAPYYAWYSQNHHPTLCVQDHIVLPSLRAWLHTAEEKPHILLETSSSQTLNQYIHIELSSIYYESKCCLSLQNYTESKQGRLEDYGVDITGRLFNKKSPGLKDSEQYRSSLLNLSSYEKETYLQNALTFSVPSPIIDSELLSGFPAMTLPLLLYYAPPGCSRNYLAHDMLSSRGFFLANYPHPISFSHAGGLCFRPQYVTLRRPKDSSRLNRVQGGRLLFENRWGQHYYLPFYFPTSLCELKLGVEQKHYFDKMTLKGLFSNIQNAPYEMGTALVEGWTTHSSQLEGLFIGEFARKTKIQTANGSIKSQILAFNFNSRVLSLSLSMSAAETPKEVSFNGVQVKDWSINLQSVTKYKQLSSIKYLSELILLQPNRAQSELYGLALQIPNWAIPTTDEYIDQLNSLLFGLPKPLSSHLFTRLINEIKRHNPNYQKSLVKKALKLTSFEDCLPVEYCPVIFECISSEEVNNLVVQMLTYVEMKRSYKYKILKEANIPYLLFEEQFQSSHYLDLIGSEVSSTSHFGRNDQIYSQITVRKIGPAKFLNLYFKVEHQIKQLGLQFDKSELNVKLFISVCKINRSGQDKVCYPSKTIIARRSLHDYQWGQLTQRDEGGQVVNFVALLSEPVQANELYITIYRLGAASPQEDNDLWTATEVLPVAFGYPLKYKSLQEEESSTKFFLGKQVVFGKKYNKFFVNEGNEPYKLLYCPVPNETYQLQLQLKSSLVAQRYHDAIAPFEVFVRKNCKPLKYLTLDFSYSALIMLFQNQERRGHKMDLTLSKRVFEVLVKNSVGPIHEAALSAVSHHLELILQNLYLTDKLPNLKTTPLACSALENFLKNASDKGPNSKAIKSVVRLVTEGLPFDNEWGRFLVKLNPPSELQGNVLTYLTTQFSWTYEPVILEWLFSLNRNVLYKYLLHCLPRSVLNGVAVKADRMGKEAICEYLLGSIVKRSQKDINPEAIKLMLKAPQRHWRNLTKAAYLSEPSRNKIAQSFLAAVSPIEAVRRLPELTRYAAYDPSLSTYFTNFLCQLWPQSRTLFTSLIVQHESIKSHYSEGITSIFLSLLTYYCNIGGVEGAKLMPEGAATFLKAALIINRKAPILCNYAVQELLTWYLINNPFEIDDANLANRSPAVLMLIELCEYVLPRIKLNSLQVLLQTHNTILQQIKDKCCEPTLTCLYTHTLLNGIRNVLNSQSSSILINDLTNHQLDWLDSLVKDLVAAKNNPTYNNLYKVLVTDLAEEAKFMSDTEIVLNANTNFRTKGSRSLAFPVSSTHGRLRVTWKEETLLSRLVIGLVNEYPVYSLTVTPSSIAVLASTDGYYFSTIGEMQRVPDQFYQAFGVTVYGLNLVSPKHFETVTTCKAIYLVFRYPLLCSVSDSLGNVQRNLKNSVYGISFVSAHGLSVTPSVSPNKKLLPLNLLERLSATLKYQTYLCSYADKSLAATKILLAKKLTPLLSVIHNYLPNYPLYELILNLHKAGTAIFEQLCSNNDISPHLLATLMRSQHSQYYFSQFLLRTLSNLANGIDALTEFISWIALNSASDVPKLKIVDLLSIIQNAKDSTKTQIIQIIACFVQYDNILDFDAYYLLKKLLLLPYPANYYDFIEVIIVQRKALSESLLYNGFVDRLVSSLLQRMEANKANGLVSSLVELNLLLAMAVNVSVCEKLTNDRVAIQVFKLMQSDQVLLLRYSRKYMKGLVAFFQLTCTNSACSSDFATELITQLKGLLRLEHLHHSFFLRELFFPLINLFEGTPIAITWKGPKGDIFPHLAAGIAKHPIPMNNETNYHVLKYLNLLTNRMLAQSSHLRLFPSSFSIAVDSFSSLIGHVYFAPAELSLKYVLARLNFRGLKFQYSVFAAMKVELKGHNEPIYLYTKLKSLQAVCYENILSFQVETSCLFDNVSVAGLAGVIEEKLPSFALENTIFKHFEKVCGLTSLIEVLGICIGKWSNDVRAQAWLQYLAYLKAFLDFPMFSNTYMNDRQNIALLFDLLSGQPDSGDVKKWEAKYKEAVKNLYGIVKQVFAIEGEQASKIRQYALQNHFFETMLERLHLITLEQKRSKSIQKQVEVTEALLPAMMVEPKDYEDETQPLKKKKGIGYGTEASTNQKWDLYGKELAQKYKNQQVIGLIALLEKYIGHASFDPPSNLVEATWESALLPFLESSLRSGSLLELSKSLDLLKQYLSLIRAFASKKNLIPILLACPAEYEPRQHESVQKLLSVLYSTSRIFLSCLTDSSTQKDQYQLAKDIINVSELVNEKVRHFHATSNTEKASYDTKNLPLSKKYPVYMKDLRFDFSSITKKGTKVKHHYINSVSDSRKIPTEKAVRLAQYLADISQALPVYHTNAIYVRCDKERVDVMQALIMGSNGTPYGHGAYIFDIYFEDGYPQGPPKVNLATTGYGKIRFNPNLYSCGKVCLSLLGTWRGSASENWDPKVSTLLQVLLSIQSIIMADEVYFNEPGFEHEQGTQYGENKNEAYANIVRYGNIMFAMLDNIRNPPPGFYAVIKKHFALKKYEILTECHKWLRLAEKRKASYTGLVHDHNHEWADKFTKGSYKAMLEKAVEYLTAELNKLPEPSLTEAYIAESPVKQAKSKTQNYNRKDEDISTVDVSYDPTIKLNYEYMDINDEKVRDRWSRYIGAVGLDAVNKQSKASIFLHGLGPLGVEIAKHLILSGCRRLTLSDASPTTWYDLSGQFFLGEADVGASRIAACLNKLEYLNRYVRVDNASLFPALGAVNGYDLVICSELSEYQQIYVNNYCRAQKIKTIFVDCIGPYGVIFNDFGPNFQVLDKNGEESQIMLIENIYSAVYTKVSLIKGSKHGLEDGDTVMFSNVVGMTLKEGEKSINGQLFKVKVINPSEFSIGDTTPFSPYYSNGECRIVKIPTEITFKPLSETLEEPFIDSNLSFCDFEKSGNLPILHRTFRSLSTFRSQYNRLPLPWNKEDAYKLVSLVRKEGYTLDEKQVDFIKKVSYTCSGVLPALCAFYGGLASQEAFKAITGKYSPIQQRFYLEYSELVPSTPVYGEYIPQSDRLEGLRKVIGKDLLTAIQSSKLFVVGAGAIGCELLKNFAMSSFGTGGIEGKEGGIIVTDPDHIYISNLNRQFLFREKHIGQPKSKTAAAAVVQMNPLLKGKMRARLDRVCENTKDVFTNEFFESLTAVTNALDNVQARIYVDQRCVEAKVALFESGTLSAKGHVQVILPYKTETYGTKADPNEYGGDIPICTLKMFPYYTLHCVEWARDIFGKTFNLKPKALSKVLEANYLETVTYSETETLKDALSLLKYKPASFEDAVEKSVNVFIKLFRDDIKQLVYTYPLDAKTKDGKPFWKLPKRPPTAIESVRAGSYVDTIFITSYAVLLCKVFGVQYPADFRTKEIREKVGKQTELIKVPPFVPSDKLAGELTYEVNASKEKEDGPEKPPELEKPKEAMSFSYVLSAVKGLISNTLFGGAYYFEKDNDQNGHIDLIYSMTNLRAHNYKLEIMDWITVKLKAGKITPALSTTTSCVAALQTLYLMKYVKQVPLELHRNAFLNLAVPIVQLGEPGTVEKIVITPELKTTIWDRWDAGEIDLSIITLDDMLKQLESKFQLQVNGISLEGAQIYSELMLSVEAKKSSKEAILSKLMKDILTERIGPYYFKHHIDFTVVFVYQSVIVKHVPTVRVMLKQTV